MGQREANPLAATRQAELARVTRKLQRLDCKGPQTIERGQGSYFGVGYDTGSRIWVQLRHCLWLISWLASKKEPTPTRFTLFVSEKMSPVTALGLQLDHSAAGWLWAGQLALCPTVSPAVKLGQ